MRKVTMAIGLILCVFYLVGCLGTSIRGAQALGDKEILNKLRDHYAERFKDPGVIESWEKGLKSDFDIDLKELVSNFEIIGIHKKGDEANDLTPEGPGDQVVSGHLIVTAYCLNMDNKVTIKFDLLVQVVIDKDCNILGKYLIMSLPGDVVNGWGGADI